MYYEYLFIVILSLEYYEFNFSLYFVSVFRLKVELFSDEKFNVLIQEYKHLYGMEDANYHNNIIKVNSREEI